MKITEIYKDEKTIVKRVDYMDKFLYTRTYFLDSDGCVEKSVTVFANGTVDIQ